jgi:diguanylate cyclase (GGDEF)-like protein/PAS domain S-box-containing protein
MAVGKFAFNAFSKREASTGDPAQQHASTKSAGQSASYAKDALLLLQNFEESGRGWFWSTDAEGRITYLSEAIRAQLDTDDRGLIGTPFVELFRKPDAEDDRQRSLHWMLMRQSRFDDLTLQAASCKDEMWWSVSGRPYHAANGNLIGYRGSGTDITVHREAAKANDRLATYDSLTGLLNRHRMNTLLQTSMAAFQQRRRPCAIMLIDLDRFKQVNDTLGHPAGDALLKQVAERLIKIVGDKECIARIGGDEFQIIVPDQDDRGALGDLADRLIANLSHPYIVEGSRCIIGASIGVAVSPFDGQTSDDLVRNADLALYAAKGGGRGRFRFYSSDLHQAAEDRRVLEQDLRDALAKDEIWLAYQPVVNAITNKVKGFEALIRWAHPERGNISPALFIPIAEDTNLIGALGEWALKKACHDASTWPGKLTVAVNVSPIQFANDLLPDVVRSALSESGLSADRLELEITESVFLQDSAATDHMFAALKDVGIRLALDDFGTGYSSLGYLRSAPFDKIKIDQSFVRDATLPGSRNGAIISAIVALAEALNMETTAEGIESLDQLDLVRSLRVSNVQGYIYSEPVPTATLLEKCEAGDWEIVPSGPAIQRPDRFSMYRKINVIHQDHCYKVVLRNLSTSGALIEGIVDVPNGTKFVIDFGDGQLALAIVSRSMGHQQGVEFEEPLVNDGNGGLCTSRRISPYMLAAAGMPLSDLPPGYYDEAEQQRKAKSLPAFGTVGEWQRK